MLVAGAHAGGLAWLTKRVIFVANADEDEPILLVELVPRPVKPLVPLPEVEARARLPEHSEPLPRLAPLPDPVPNPLPDTLRQPGPPQVTLPAPAPDPAPRAEPEAPVDPFLAVSPQARQVLSSLQCGRLTAERDLPCGEGAPDRLETAAGLKPAQPVLPGERIEIASNSTFGTSSAGVLAARQGDPYAGHPYRLGSLDASPTRGGPHAIPDSAPGSQAMRDMGERAIAMPHPVWGD